MRDFPKDRVFSIVKETFNEQLKFSFGTSSRFVIIDCFVTKETYCLLKNVEKLISAQPRISAHLG